MVRTKQQRSVAAKKGWQKRKRTAAKVVGGYAIARTARPLVSAGLDHRRRTKYQHTWVRPNGDKVSLRGFDPKSMPSMRRSAAAVDRHVDPKHSIDGTSIWIRKLPDLKKVKDAGGAMFISEDKFDRMADIARGGKKASKRERFEQDMAKGAIGIRKETHIRIPRSSLRQQDTTGVITHELGHLFDGDHHRFSESKSFRDHTMRLKKDRIKPHYTGNRQAYQVSSAGEEFAETFRMGIHNREGGLHNIDFKVWHPPKFTGAREHYLNEKVFASSTPPLDSTRIINKPGLHNHYDKFVLGGVAVGVGGAALYHHHKMETDSAYRKRYQERVNHARSRLQRIG